MICSGANGFASGLALRKRHKTGAVQDAPGSVGDARCREASWSAPVVRRFQTCSSNCVRQLCAFAAGLAALIPLVPSSTSACAACYGASDAPMAQGMNWGILSLLGVIVSVLAIFAGFFIFLARRAAAPTPPGAGTQSGLVAPAPVQSAKASSAALTSGLQPAACNP